MSADTFNRETVEETIAANSKMYDGWMAERTGTLSMSCFVNAEAYWKDRALVAELQLFGARMLLQYERDLRAMTIQECAERAWLHVPDTLRADIVRSAILEMLEPSKDKP